MFAPGSRYERVGDAAFEQPDGRIVSYKLLRIPPPPAPVSQEARVAEGERLDLIAHRLYGDPEQFWRICDANRVLRADELERPGRRLTIPLAGG
jgi:nucleoid-associated protein YgaU